MKIRDSIRFTVATLLAASAHPQVATSGIEGTVVDPIQRRRRPRNRKVQE
jgi:hypothetical protein